VDIGILEATCHAVPPARRAGIQFGKISRCLGFSGHISAARLNGVILKYLNPLARPDM
jgi:hypothetical protein